MQHKIPASFATSNVKLSEKIFNFVVILIVIWMMMVAKETLKSVFSNFLKLVNDLNYYLLLDCFCKLSRGGLLQIKYGNYFERQQLELKFMKFCKLSVSRYFETPW